MPYIGQSLTEGTRREYTYVATASQTTFNAIYTVGAVDVHQNGILLAPSDYTATTGTTVVFNTGAALNDEITIHCHNTFSVADTVSASQGGTFNQPLTVEGDAATVLTVDRATSDGSIVDFKKSGTTVGSIGNYSGTGNTLLVGSSTSHLAISHDAAAYFPAAGQNTVKDNAIDLGRDISRFKNLYLSGGVVGTAGTRIYSSETNGSGLILSTGVIYPSGNTGATANGQVDLGSAGVKFKDLYLSGGVYLGGTGAANKLDDYEEGTFTPVLSTSNFTNTGFSSTSCSYVKVGGMVTVQLDLIFAGTSGSWAVGNYFELSSLPFPAEQPSGADNYYSGTLNASTSYSTNTKSTWDVLQSGFGLLCLCTYSNGSPTKGAAVIGSYTYNTSV